MKKHLNIFFPQWQGGGKDKSTYAGAVEIKKNYLGNRIFRDVEVSLEEDCRIQNGIIGYQPIMNQLKRCKELILQEQPTSIFTIGGGCDIAIAPISYLNSVVDLTVLWFDAHGDLNTPETSISKAFHGMPLRTLLGEGDNEILQQTFSVLTPSQIILLGNRDLDNAETQYIEKENMNFFKVEDLETDANCLLAAMKAQEVKNLYIHIDLDVIDPVEFPFVPVPAVGGLTIPTFLRLLKTVYAEFPTVGLSLVEYQASGRGKIEIIEEIINLGVSL